jgi:methylenetetrahydrofolate reductase (NADH)
MPAPAAGAPVFPRSEVFGGIADLIASGSLEMTADRADDARAIAALLPAGTRIYVNHLPRHTLDDSLLALVAVRQAGLEPVPHIAARRIPSRTSARMFLEEAVRRANVSKVLLVGGDDPQPRGPYSDGAALLRDGMLAGSGVREVALPGYPEGHPVISRDVLERALMEKLELAAAQGLGTYLVTQFSFAPARVIEYCAWLARRIPDTPVYVGLAGPTDARALLRFAQRCGVSASLRALRAQGMGAVNLVMHTDPAEQLAAITRYCLAHAACNVVGAHLFTFGGAARTAAWMNQVIASNHPGPVGHPS